MKNNNRQFHACANRWMGIVSKYDTPIFVLANELSIIYVLNHRP